MNLKRLNETMDALEGALAETKPWSAKQVDGDALIGKLLALSRLVSQEGWTDQTENEVQGLIDELDKSTVVMKHDGSYYAQGLKNASDLVGKNQAAAAIKDLVAELGVTT